MIVLTGLLAACAPPAAAPPQAQGTSDIQVFFTDPNAPGAEFARGGPDEALRAAIEAAHVSIDVAIYDLNLYGIRDALIDAQNRGAAVRMVVESESFTAEELSRFTANGIQVVTDGNPDSMHDKFFVIDRYEVWTGSVNLTLSDVYGNRNNLVRLRSMALAENYEAEFEEMFSQGLFGDRSPSNTPHPRVEIDGVWVESYFAPEDGVEARLVAYLNDAEASIHFLAFSLTSDAVAEALLAAQRRGVEVQGVMDEAQAANAGGEHENLAANGIDVRLEAENGSLHHKLLIIDGEIVITGSYNFSANAERRNDENVLVIHNAAVASEFMEEFQRVWQLAVP